MYNKKLVASIMVNGKILRENNDTVCLPFGSEYSILFKNLNNIRVAVKVEIDGQDIGNGSQLIIDAGETLELKRFISTNNAFKFIEKTEEISEHRGDKIDDGIIRIEYQFERQHIIYQEHNYYQDYKNSNITPLNMPWNCYNSSPSTSSTTNVSNVTKGSTSNTEATYSAQSCSNTNINLDSIEDGITVQGGKTDQSFRHIHCFLPENESNLIVLMLKGYNNNEQIVKPLYVKTKIECPTCGKKCKSNNKFCPKCGTSLISYK